jgi:hypothetical protein
LSTLFDYLTVACFFGIAGAFFTLTTREPKTLLHLIGAGLVFGLANQVGNAGYAIAGFALVLAGLVYSVVVIRNAWST